MSEWTIYYNPKCFSCRKALSLLEARDIHPRIVEYMKEPPTAEELDDLLRKLGMDPQYVVRRKNHVYEELGLAERRLPREEWLNLIAENPSLLERPIVVRDNRAVIARPPARVNLLLERP